MTSAATQTLISALAGGILAAAVAIFSARAGRRHQNELEWRRFWQQEYARLRGRRDALYVTFLQAGKDIEFLQSGKAVKKELHQQAAADVESNVEMVRGATLDFDKLAQEVKLYASPAVSDKIDELAAAWMAWLAADEVSDGRDACHLETKHRYLSMFASMQSEVGPQEVQLALAGGGEIRVRGLRNLTPTSADDHRPRWKMFRRAQTH